MFFFLAFFHYEPFEKRDFSELKINLWEANTTTEVSWWSVDDACNRSETANTIHCKAGTKSKYTFWRYVIDEVPDGIYKYAEIKCNGKGIGGCGVGVTIGVNGQAVFHDYVEINNIKNFTFSNPVNNNICFQLSFTADSDTEDTIYDVPEIRLLYLPIAKQTKEYTVKEIENVENGKVYSTHVSKDDGPVRLYSHIIKLPHEMKTAIETPNVWFKADGEYLEVPIVANSTHILGMSVLDQSYFHGWVSEYVMYEGSLSIVFTLYAEARDSNGFDISYYLIERKTTSWRDAIEKWHACFPDIYHVQPYGSGAWIPWPKVNTNETCVTEDELINKFNGKFQWGYYQDQGSSKLPFFGYIEPTKIHDFKVNFTEETVEQDVKEAMENGDKAAEMIWKYALKDRNGKRLIENGFFKTYGIMCSVMWSDELFEYQNNYLVNRNNQHCQIATGSNCSGVALDSTSPGAVTYDLTQLNDSMPYYLVESWNDLQGRYIPQICGYFKLMKQYSPLSAKGYMMNAYNAPQQLTKYVANVGWETSMVLQGKFVYSNWYKQRFWKARYSLGSRSYSDIDESDNEYIDKFFEEYMSTKFAFGSTPSFDNDFYSLNCHRIRSLWHDFERWEPVIKKVLDGNIFYANGRGLIEGNFTNLDDYAMFCDKSLENCYVNIFITTDNPVVVQVGGNIKPVCIFSANDTTCEVDGNNVTVQMHNVPKERRFRLATIQIKDETKDETKDGTNDDKNKGLTGGEIAGIVIGVIAFIAIIVVCVVFFLFRKKNDDSEKGDDKSEGNMSV